MTAAHPRSRGENSAPATAIRRPCGSSPLTRGKPHRRIQGVVARRLIPAHAGKTAPWADRGNPRRAHPRSRGENRLGETLLNHLQGSSQLTRGKLTLTIPVSCVIGLIPAHAGKTSSTGSHAAPRWAHPRSRGENGAPPGPTGPTRGSSPLTRGKRGVLLARLSGPRLIPAHAGKTGNSGHWAALLTAHPRSRGENHMGDRPPVKPLGSSPLTRGKRERASGCQVVERLIPAHAGKTRSR